MENVKFVEFILLRHSINIPFALRLSKPNLILKKADGKCYM